MAEKRTESVEALEILLHDRQIAVLAHYSGSRNILTFNPAYRDLPVDRQPLFTLTQKIRPGYLHQPLTSTGRLPPVLSNLLSEGALREWMARELKVHVDAEFPLIAFAGNNLPGALVARPLPLGGIPAWAQASRGDRLVPVQIEVRHQADKFSLAGVQMKFSALRQDGRFMISNGAGRESWIIKTPSTVHKGVPENEFSAMLLAQAIGVTIPEVKLIPLAQLDALPDIPLPGEPYAYGIRRFDRHENGRIHTEDFAQIFEVYPHEKYRRFNYDQLAATLYRVGGGGLADIQQMARRLLANILLGNGDAHLKNWTVYYPDGLNARLSPAYDILSTLPYVRDEQEVALNMAHEKRWYQISMATFAAWAARIGVPWPALRVHLEEARQLAHERWPVMLAELPMHEAHKQALQAHQARLHPDFRLPRL